MAIRRAEVRDTEDVLKLLVQVNMVHHTGRPDIFDGPATKYTREELAAIFADEERPVFVLTDEKDTRVLGYAFCMIEQHLDDHILTPIKTLYLDDLCVDEEARGQKVGSRLYGHVLDYARSIGCYHVTLNVWECNPSARKFYEAQGMSVLKTAMEQIL